MFLTIVSVIFILILIWAGMIWLRKSLWDVVHRNLLDMEDSYEGKVLRDGFAARPVFHGKVNGKSITVNFSSARAGNKRQNYIDVTVTTEISQTLTIAEANWLKTQNGEEPMPNSQIVKTADKVQYHLMPGGKSITEKLMKNQSFLKQLTEFDHLAYFFIGKTGAICEFYTEALDKDTEFSVMEKRLGQVDTLLALIDKESELHINP